MILTVANLKGGTSKTTSAAFLAHALAERGRRVLVVDADPQASITRWAEMAEWRLPVVGKATGRLHVELEEIVGDRFDAVVIDTPPTDKLRGIVESAIRAATTVLVPIGPTSAEYERTAMMPPESKNLDDFSRHPQ